MPAAAVVHLDDPEIRIEADLPGQIGLDLNIGRGLHRETGREPAVDRVSFVECRLRGRPVEISRPVEPVDLDEDRARFLSTTPPHQGVSPLVLAATQIGRYPDRGLETHRAAIMVVPSSR